MKIKDKLKEIFYSKELYIFSVITMLFFGAFCVLQYAPDTYSVFTNDLKHTVLHFLSCGRFVTGAASYFAMGILKLGNQGIYMLSYGFGIICTIISLYKLNKLIKKDVKNDIVCIIISTLIIINPFSLELFLYIEKGIMLLSVLLCVLAVEQMDKFFNGNKKSILLALIFMFIANCCYQGTVGLFVAISLIYIIKYSKNIKEFILNNIIVALVYGIPALFNFLVVRFLFTNTRVNGRIIFSESISKIIEETNKMFIDTYNLLPQYLFISAIAILLGIIIYKAIIQKSEVNEKILKILGAIYLIVGTLFATVAPQILQDTSSIWFVARSSYSMAAIIGILTLYLFIKFDINRIEKNSIIILLILFLIIQFSNFMVYTIDNFIGNYMDKEITLEINSIIQEYEEKTGNKIDSISIYKDKTPQYAYTGIKASGDINIKAYSADWCVSRILKLYTNRDLKEVDNDITKKEEFLKKNWDYFSREQVIFEDNVMHLCVF